MFSNMKPAEKRLLEACQKGEHLFLGQERPTEKTVDNEIRGEFLRALILNNNKKIEENSNKYILKIDTKGIQFSGVYVSGNFNFSFCSTELPFYFISSVFEKKIDISESKIRFLNLHNCKVTAINGQGLFCQSDIFLRDGFEANEKVDFNSAYIVNLDCRNGKFINENGDALICDSAKIKGSVFLNEGFEAKGEVDFHSCFIGKSLIFSKANEILFSG